jgi:tetratricopeptide (TPR) repeat protein
MKFFKYIFIFCFFTTNFSYAISFDEIQLKAEKAYADKNYKVAIQQYDSILKSGFSSYKLYYNLANAYYKNNQIGSSIYYYELANKLEPNNADVKNNLSLANQKTIDKIESNENYFVSVIKSSIINIVSTNSWAWISIVSLFLSFLLLFLFIISYKTIIKRICFFTGSFFIIIFILSMIFGFISHKDKNNIKFAIILKYECKVQTEPVTDSKTKFLLHEGTKVKVLETNPEWTNIKLENGNEGWLPTNQLGLF